ncbi:MAG: hypothetical protein HQK58_08560 [Deltaproteobacteria bacterium]|nr:hypothetical protein [Deltaproteobacteria bacterium]
MDILQPDAGISQLVVHAPCPYSTTDRNQGGMDEDYTVKSRVGAEYVYHCGRSVPMPEQQVIPKDDSPEEMIMALAQSKDQNLNIIFGHPAAEDPGQIQDNEALVTFCSSGQDIPPKLAPNHYRFPLTEAGYYRQMEALLKAVDQGLPNRRITVYLSRPKPSWRDWLTVGVMVFRLMRLLRVFPRFRITVIYPGQI